MNRKGITQQIMMVIIMFIVLIGIISVFWLVATAGPIVAGTGTLALNSIKAGIATNQPNSSIQNASNVAINTTASVIGTAELFIYLFFIGLFIGYLVIAYYVRTYPFLSVIWIFMIIAATFFAMILSNAYQQSSQDSNLSSFYQTWGTNDFLMRFLPHLTALFGIIGGILLFVLISREPEAEVQYL